MENQQEKQLLPTWCCCFGKWQCDESLSDGAFRLLTIICSISDNGKRPCYATNSKFEKITKKKTRQIQNLLKELRDLNYIDIIYTTNYKNNKSVRNIYIKSISPIKKFDEEFNQSEKEELFEWDWLEECE